MPLINSKVTAMIKQLDLACFNAELLMISVKNNGGTAVEQPLKTVDETK